jgi:hypothetical protein
MGDDIMSDPLEYVRLLADSAQRETPPRGHVASNVIFRLRAESPSMAGPLARFAVMTAVMAAMALFVSISSLTTSTSTATDPVSAFFQVASTLQL